MMQIDRNDSKSDTQFSVAVILVNPSNKCVYTIGFHRDENEERIFARILQDTGMQVLVYVRYFELVWNRAEIIIYSSKPGWQLRHHPANIYNMLGLAMKDLSYDHSTVGVYSSHIGIICKSIPGESEPIYSVIGDQIICKQTPISQLRDLIISVHDAVQSPPKCSLILLNPW